MLDRFCLLCDCHFLYSAHLHRIRMPRLNRLAHLSCDVTLHIIFYDTPPSRTAEHGPLPLLTVSSEL